ncbi:Phage tail sheath protein [compost metagenome]
MYGPAGGFPLTDGASNKFRAVLDNAGEVTIDIEYREVGTDALVQMDEVKAFAIQAKTAEVVDNNTDASGAAMIANGSDKSFTLTEVPKAGLKLYADGAEVTDVSVYAVDAAGKKVTVKNTVKIKRGQLLEAAYGYDVTNIITPTIELESVYGGNVYNDMKAKVEIDTGIITITITKPDAKKSLMSEPAMVFKSTDFPSFQLMCNAINTHSYNGNVVRATTKYLDAKTNTLEAKPETYFSGGDDELYLSKEELYKRLGGTKDSEGYIVKQGAYQLLENYSVDMVVPLGVYADDVLIGKYDNFAYQLALACAVMSHYNSVTHGLIATSSPQGTTLAEVEEHVQKILAQPNTFYMRDRFGAEIKDGDGERIDIGQFISVLAGPDIIVGNTRLGAIATTPTAAYAGMVSQLPVQSAPTNKVLANALGLRFEYSASQLNRLTEARFTTLKLKNNNTAVAVVDAMTAAHSGSDYQRQSTGRIVKAAVNAIREVADPFIGEPNDQSNRNALAAAISKRLDKMKENKQLLGFDFQIVATTQMELMGEAQIELSLQAPNELRQLTTIVSLT